MIVSWLLFPAVLLAVLMGCGLLVRGLVDRPVAGALVPGMGFALVTCVGLLTTASDETAELTTPVIVALAVAGYLGAWPFDWRGWRAALPAATAGVAVFLVYGAPIIMSGDATFAGYIKLDDTATWLALTDRVMEHGRSLEGLAPSTYEATLAFNLGGSYPVGAFLALGVGSELVPTDTAWTIQPYMSVLAGVLAATMVEVARPLVSSAWLRAAAAFVAAQSSILVGFVLWGGVKEIVAALLIAVGAALVPPAMKRGSGASSVVPLALVAAGLLAVLTYGGALWLLSVLVVPLVLLWVRAYGSARGFLVFAAITAAILVPLAVAGKLVPPADSPLWSADEKGNLLGSLSVFQIFGIWPVGDFRLRPDEAVVTAILIALAAAAAVTSVATAMRRRAVGLLLYWGSAVVGAVVLFVFGSPWVDAKAIAMASPAIALAASLGIAILFERGLRTEACIAGLLIAGGVFVSNYMGYRDVNLAPRDQLAELEAIGQDHAGEGPALMTEYNPYGARHFLRHLDAEGASELRRSQVPLTTGEVLEKGAWADTDAFALSSLYPFRTLVLRRSPAQSRPPLPYTLLGSGRYYDVWQRPEGAPPQGLELMPLGSETDPVGRVRCSEIEQLASLAGKDGALAYVERIPNVVVPARNLDHPESWSGGTESFLVPRETGTASASVDLPQASHWTIWLGGSVRGRMEARVDGEEVGSARAFLNYRGMYVPLGSADLPAGQHTVEIAYSGTDLHPGSGGDEPPIGPLILEAGRPGGQPVSLLPADQGARLCGQAADWVQAVPAEAITVARSSQ